MASTKQIVSADERTGARAKSPAVEGWSDGWREAVEALVPLVGAEPWRGGCWPASGVESEDADNAPKAAAARRGQRLGEAVMRDWRLLETVLERLVKRRPRAMTWAVLLCAGARLGAAQREAEALIVHHAVNLTKSLCSVAEAGLVNAVLRRFPSVWEEMTAPGGPLEGHPPVRWSHPDWLWRRWKARYGHAKAVALMVWNQQIPPVYLRVDQPSGERGEAGAMGLVGLEATPWAGFWRYRPAEGVPGLGGLLSAGGLRAYACDPFTRHPVDLLEARGGERMADWCAAPGGKTWQIALGMGLTKEALEAAKGSRLGGGGSQTGLWAVDLPGERLQRLRQNLERLCPAAIPVVGLDLLRESTAVIQERLGAALFDGILLDAPCSNTGVLRRRVDARWRLSEDAVQGAVRVQEALLARAARFVRSGGRLVYSTCSLESEENEDLVQAFLASANGVGWVLRKQKISLPVEDNHDGGGAFLLQKEG